MPLTCLAPDIVEAILDGRQPKGLRLTEMLGSRPLAWEEQPGAVGIRKRRQQGSSGVTQVGDGPMTADPAWYEWAFWARDSGSLRDLALITAALVGAPLLVWRTWAVAKGAAASRTQARTAVEAHLTDRLAKAFEQLVSERVETKLAGLYVLERLAKTSGDLHWPIVKSLSAYVQENSRFVDWVACESGEEPVTQEPAEHWWSEARPPREIGFIVRVICDRNKKFDPPDGHVNLWGSRLNGIDFRAFDLKKADFTLCNLRGANFSGSSLRSARFVHARLEGAVFNGADLADADLTGAHLGSVDLTRTKGLSQRQLDEAVGDERTKLPEGLSIGTGTQGRDVRVSRSNSS